MLVNNGSCYELIITTKYNVITLYIDDYNSPEIKEILNQPYIVSVEMHKLKNKEKIKKRVIDK